MSNTTPTIEFYRGLSEELSNVSLRRDKTGARVMVMMFERLQAIDIINSFTRRYRGSLYLIDDEGEIRVEPDSVKFFFGGDEGDELKRVECAFQVSDQHWARVMRFMHRYAEANGMEYGEKSK